MRKKILILTPFNPKYIGGAETFAKDMITEARKRFRVGVVTLSRQFKAWDEPGLFESMEIFMVLLFKALFRRGYKTVNAHGIIAGGVAVILKKLFGVKVVVTLLALYNFKDMPDRKIKLTRWVLGNADVIFVEDQIAMNRLFFLRLNTPIKIFMHWTDLERFKPFKKLTDDSIRVLFVGRPIYKKGMHLVKALEPLLKPRGVIFHYATNVPYKYLDAYYKQSDIFIIPSIYDEGVTRVVLEAAACGCFVIASNRGSLDALVDPFGAVCEPTVSEFERIIKTYLNKLHLREEVKRKTRKYAEEHFSCKNAEVILEEL